MHAGQVMSTSIYERDKTQITHYVVGQTLIKIKKNRKKLFCHFYVRFHDTFEAEFMVFFLGGHVIFCVFEIHLGSNCQWCNLKKSNKTKDL